MHRVIAEKHRKNKPYQNMESFNIENLDLFPDFNHHPILFIDIYAKEKQ